MSSGSRWQSLPVDYLRIWADEEGESHLEEIHSERMVQPPSAGTTELRFTAGVPVDRLQFLDADAAHQEPDWHCAPRRQFVVFLDGWARITASDGKRRDLVRGGVVLAEDLHGRGHVTELEPVLADPVNFGPSPIGHTVSGRFQTGPVSRGGNPGPGPGPEPSLLKGDISAYRP